MAQSTGIIAVMWLCFNRHAASGWENMLPLSRLLQLFVS